MKKLLIPFLALSLIFTLTACGKKETPPSIEQKPETIPYINDEFGFSLETPASWTVQTQEEQDKIAEIGKELVAGEDKEKQAEYDASLEKTRYLLTVFKEPIGAAVEFNPSFMIIVENIQEVPDIDNAEKYLAATKTIIESGSLKYTFDKPVYSEQIGGKEFKIMEATAEINGKKVSQKIAATIINGHALNLMSSYATEEDQQDLDKIFASVKFTP